MASFAFRTSATSQRAIPRPIPSGPSRFSQVIRFLTRFSRMYTTQANMDLFALAGASVIFEKRGVLCSGASWKQRDKECTRHYHHAADLIRLWRKHQ
jgi:hypothetical protein